MHEREPTGMIEIVSNLFNDYAERLARQCDTHAHASADAITEKAISVVAVDTGDLQSTIKTVKVADASYEVQAGDASAAIDYASHIEWGTATQSAQPFLTPSAESERPNLIDRISMDTF